MTGRPIEILHVYKDYWPVVGGIENHVKALAEGTNWTTGFHASVLVTNPGRRRVVETIDGVPVTKVGRLATTASAPLAPGLVSEIWRSTADLIHLHFPYPIGEMAYLVAGRNRPMVVTYHSDIVRQQRLLRLYRPILRRVLQRADSIIVGTPRYAAGSPYLQRHRANLRVVHYGIDAERYAPTADRLAAADRIRADAKRPIVLFAGVLRYYKGVSVLVEAMRDIDAILVVVGDGPELRALQDQAAASPAADRIVFRGRLSDAALDNYFAAASVFALPSILRAESFGIVLLEAMAAGLPLVTTEIGTGTSYVNVDGTTGFVVPPNQPSALASAINAILADPALQARFGAAARERVQREFSARQMIDGALAVYRSVLETHRGRRQPLC